MIELLNKNAKLKNIIVICLSLLILLSLSINFYIEYKTQKEFLYNKIDTQLKTAALNTALLLGDKFFERAIDKNSISKEEDIQNMFKLSKLAKNSGVKYVYTMIEKNNTIYFTSSSFTDEETKNNNIVVYYDKYDEATDKLKHIFDIEEQL